MKKISNVVIVLGVVALFLLANKALAMMSVCDFPGQCLENKAGHFHADWMDKPDMTSTEPAIHSPGGFVKFGSEIELWGIEPLREGDELYFHAQEVLRDIIGTRQIICRRKAISPDNNSVMRCAVQIRKHWDRRVDIAAELVARGMAFASEKAGGNTYKKYEMAAWDAKAGVWAEPNKMTAPTRQRFIRTVLRLADTGRPRAQYNAGLFYASGKKRDLAASRKYMTAAAEQKYVPAIRALSDDPVWSQTPGNRKKALDWARLAAEEGDSLGKELYAGFLLSGYAGQEDINKALDLLIELGKRSDLTGILRLAELLEAEGRYQEAADWYYEAAIRNHAQSQLTVARAYKDGRGLPINLVKAYAWAFLANKAGAKGSDGALKAIAAELSDTDLDRALSLARELKADYFQR